MTWYQKIYVCQIVSASSDIKQQEDYFAKQVHVKSESIQHLYCPFYLQVDEIQ